MNVSKAFNDFLDNLKIDNTETITNRYHELTSALNKHFRDTDSKTDNTLQVGSFGRGTGIKGISDLDMVYIVPKSKWNDYKVDGQYRLLREVKEAICKRYPKTDIRVDRLVVTVTYTNFLFEVQPVFEQEDGSFLYPDTKRGSWQPTKPREEIEAFNLKNQEKNRNLKRFCRMIRAWKNEHGVCIGGLLIDTLVFNFLESTTKYDNQSYSSYGSMSLDFFKYISDLQIQGEYAAPGSRQRVKVKKPFQKKAKKAYDLCLKAIEAQEPKKAHSLWREIYGNSFPSELHKDKVASDCFSKNYDDTEEFIEQMFPINIREHMELDCDVMQNGFRPHSLLEMLANRWPLQPQKQLCFKIKTLTTSPPYQIYWKVLNRGKVAIARNNIRGQIVADDGTSQKKESTVFQGNHIVECYCVKNGIVVARDRILVPIVTR